MTYSTEPGTDHGYPSHVVVEAVGSRHPSDKALARMRYPARTSYRAKCSPLNGYAKRGLTETFRLVSREFIW
jgi:hypothetical protein